MADLWQSYSGWVLYGVFFAVFVWLHLRMHGGGGHGCGHAGHSHGGQSGSGHHHEPAEVSDDNVSGMRKAG